MSFAQDAFSAFASADAEFFGAFDGTYTALEESTSEPVQVMLDTVTEEAGDFGGTVDVASNVTVLKPSPVLASGGIVVANGLTFALESLIEDDGISERWRCRRG